MKNTLTEINKAVQNHRELSKFGRVEMVTNNIPFMKALLESYGDWNDYRGHTVAETMEMIYNELPLVYYNEGNPNNGSKVFSSVHIHSDSLITLESYGNLSEEQLQLANDVVERYGKLMKADERWIEVDDSGYHNRYTIRFWWD